MQASSYRFYFAYLGNDETYATYDPAAYAREDEKILSLSVDQEEGEAAGAKIGITYRAGSYVALGRRAVISCRKLNQITGALTGPVIPLIVGRIIAAPIGRVGEVVELQLVAKTDDWEARRAAFLSGYLVVGTFDPLFYEPGVETDVASVLEHHGAVLAWDRFPRNGVSSLRLSYLLEGRDLEDDMGGFSEIELFNIAHDDIQRQVDMPPLRSVTIEMAATWQQDASVRSEVKWKHGRFLDVVAHQAVQDAWPDVGADLGGGWSVEERSLSFGQPRFEKLGEIAGGYDSAIYSGDVPVYRAKVARVALKNDRKQARTEVVRVTMAANIQELMAPETETKTYALRQIIGTGDDVDPWQPRASYEVGDVVFYMEKIYECRVGHTATFEFDMPKWRRLGDDVGNVAETFFQTARGQKSIQFATMLAASALRKRARAVVYTVSVPLEDVINIAIDDMIKAHLPDQTVTGKVTRYQLNGGGWAEVEFACSIFKGTYSESGTPTLTGAAPRLGPTAYQATGSVTPSAKQQIAALREAPDAYSLEATVEINAPAVPSTYELRREVSLSAGTLWGSKGVTVE